MLRPRTVLAIALTGSLSIAAARPLLQGMEMPKPTREHAMVQKGVGTWEGTVTMFVPGMPQTPVPAKETVRSAGRFWTISKFESQFMGQPYQGHGCHGYDPSKGKFVGTWVDSMSSFLSIMEGEYDAETKTMVSTWDAPDMTGAMAPHRSERTWTDDTYSMTFYTNDAKTMVIEMTRTGATPREAGATPREAAGMRKAGTQGQKKREKAEKGAVKRGGGQ